MKKVMHKLIKKKKKEVPSYGEVAADAVPEPPRNLPSHVIKPSELYNNFRVDTCSSGKMRCQLDSVGSEIEESMRVDDFNETSLDVNAVPITPSDRSVASGSSAEESSSEDVVISPAPSPEPLQNHARLMNGSQSGNVNPLNGVTGSDHLNNQAVPYNDKGNSLTKNNNRHRPDKSGYNGNKYVITISNSKHFHIGSQKTINYTGGIDGSIMKNQLVNVSNQKVVTENGNHLLDSKEKLSEDDVLRISLNIHDKWRDFAVNLGLDESVIRDSEISNDGDGNLIVHDLLQQFLKQYPSTTLGYIISLLKKSGEEDVIRKLTEGR